MAALALPGDKPGYQIDARGSGMIGPVGLDLALRTRLSGERASDGLVWTGARVPFYTAKEHRFTAGMMLHGQLPTTQQAADPAIEPALALGGLRGSLSWVVNAGGRVRLGHQEERLASAAGQGFLVAGLALKMSPWVRGYVNVDGRWLAEPPEGEALRAGGTLGVEIGKTWFAGAAARLGLREPSTQGATTLQLTIGLRDAFL